jgi:hypothetical protein
VLPVSFTCETGNRKVTQEDDNHAGCDGVTDKSRKREREHIKINEENMMIKSTKASLKTLRNNYSQTCNQIIGHRRRAIFINSIC